MEIFYINLFVISISSVKGIPSVLYYRLQNLTVNFYMKYQLVQIKTVFTLNSSSLSIYTLLFLIALSDFQRQIFTKKVWRQQESNSGPLGHFQLSNFFPLPFPPVRPFLPLISAPTGFHDWGLVTRWAQLLITSLTSTYPAHHKIEV